MIDFSTELGRRAKIHLEQEYFIWFTTVDSDLTPQPRPVWFIWDGDSFLIFSQPHAHKVGHVQKHPNVALHFNSDEKADEDVIVFLGKAELDPGTPPAHTLPAYFEKYRSGIEELNLTPEAFSQSYSTTIRVRPFKLRSW